MAEIKKYSIITGLTHLKNIFQPTANQPRKSSNNIILNNMGHNHIEQGGERKTMNTDHEHQHETDELWKKSEQSPFISGLREGEKVADIMERLDYQRAFEKRSKVLGCSDGRCRGHRLGLPGDGILALQTDQEKCIRMLKDGGVDEVYSHANCGAATLALRNTPPEHLPIGVKTAEDLAKYHAEGVARKLGAKCGHTEVCDMSGEVHNERAIYFDGTGMANPEALPELPAGFIYSGPALGMREERMQADIETLASIALGDHGFGKRFTKEKPLYVVISAKDREQLEALTEIAEKAAEQFHGRVAVDSFIAK